MENENTSLCGFSWHGEDKHDCSENVTVYLSLFSTTIVLLLKIKLSIFGIPTFINFGIPSLRNLGISNFFKTWYTKILPRLAARSHHQVGRLIKFLLKLGIRLPRYDNRLLSARQLMANSNIFWRLILIFSETVNVETT